MNVKFFASLSPSSAQEYLSDFLIFGSERGVQILEKRIDSATKMDFTLTTIAPILEVLVSTVETVPKSKDPSLPTWITDTADYQNGLFDFNEESNMVILAGAYYLGETFVRNFENLRWTIGNVDYAEGNMPVVSKFKHEIEMAPIWIVENLFRRIIKDPSRLGDINTAVSLWINDVAK